MRGDKIVYNFKYLPMDAARVICSVLIPVFRIRRLTASGEKYTKRLRGGAVIAANHTSFADPFIVGVTFWYRRMYMLAAEIVMGGPVRSLLLKGVGCIRVDRNAADIEAVKKCIAVLKDGHPLTVFPQGGISDDGGISALKSGAVLMALQSGTPIIPMYIAPKKGRFSRRTVVIGDAIDPKSMVTKKIPSTADIDNITNALMQGMNKCKESCK